MLFQRKISNISSIIQISLLKPEVMVLICNDFNTSMEVFVRTYSTMLYAVVSRSMLGQDNEPDHFLKCDIKNKI